MRQSSLVRRHLVLGWVWIVLFSLVGLALEGLHGLKAGAYLDVGVETRRLMWTLAHAHGSLLGLLHIALAVTLPHTGAGESALRLASRAMTAAGVLLPAGFFLGGLTVHGGDPSLGILLVPLGALALVLSAATVVRAVHRARVET